MSRNIDTHVSLNCLCINNLYNMRQDAQDSRTLATIHRTKGRSVRNRKTRKCNAYEAFDQAGFNYFEIFFRHCTPLTGSEGNREALCVC